MRPAYVLKTRGFATVMVQNQAVTSIRQRANHMYGYAHPQAPRVLTSLLLLVRWGMTLSARPLAGRVTLVFVPIRHLPV